ncbi:nuclease domain-containing protein [Escherichia coli]
MPGRIPGVCNGNSENARTGRYPAGCIVRYRCETPYLIATIACSACHDESTAAQILSMLHMQKNARWKVWRDNRLSG